MRKPDSLHASSHQTTDKYCLYSFFSSTCCQRIILAAHLKSIPLTFSYLDLRDGPLAEKSLSNQSLGASVPTLVVTHCDGSSTIVCHAVAILEHFEERFPDSYPLLPSPRHVRRRNLARDFIGIIAIEVGPPTSSRIAKRARAIVSGGLEEQEQSAAGALRDGFAAYQALLKATRGSEAETCLYTVGDAITLADVCLVPTVEQAIAYGVDMRSAPHILRIYNHLRKLPAFTGVDWRKNVIHTRYTASRFITQGR